MSAKIQELTGRWKNFSNGLLKQPGFVEADEQDLEQYSALMVETLQALKEEWNPKTVNGDIIKLIDTMRDLSVECNDPDMESGTDEYQRMDALNEMFLD